MKKILSIATLFLLLTGCANTPNVPLSQDFWKHPNTQEVNVGTNKHPEAQLFQEGTEGLADIVVNSMVTNTFSHYLKNYQSPTLENLPYSFSANLKSHKVKSSLVGNTIEVSKLADNGGKNTKEYADHDFTGLATQVGADKLLLVSVERYGATRSYYGFIPLGAPKAYCRLEGRLVNLTNNKILWRYISDVRIPVEGAWDQPPQYPNFTISLNKAIATAKQELTDSLLSGTDF